MALQGREPTPAAPRSGAAARPGRTGAPPLVTRLESLQHACGNRAVARLLTTPTPRRLARVKWTDADTIAEAALNPRLKAALDLARASPDVKPATPGWVVPAIKGGMGYDAQLHQAYQDYLGEAQPRWNKLGAQGQAKFKTIQEYSKGGWVKKEQQVVKGLDDSVTKTMEEYKWGEPFMNLKGDLPGTAGAGGYREYYAEPEASQISPTEGTWGKNRILHKVNADGGHQGEWWVTDDHYVNFKRVVP